MLTPKNYIVVLLYSALSFNCAKNQREYYSNGNLFRVFVEKQMNDSTIFVGPYIEYYPNKQKKIEVVFDKAGHKHGLQVVWDSLGNVLQKCSYLHGMKTGGDTLFYTNGCIEQVAIYRDGTLGQAFKYYPNGATKEVTQYCRGVLCDTAEFWDSSGTLQRKIHYQNGSKTKEVAFYSNGNKELEISFKNGVPDGESFVWFENGKIKMKGSASEGKPCGDATAYDSTGRIVSSKIFDPCVHR